jgi:XTP/dITP diphosphohydrolase
MKIKEIILATGNKHKVSEIKDILSDLNVNIKPMMEFDNYPNVVEDGLTLEENATKKAVEVAKFFNSWAVADDTGLEVEYLNGAPGVFAARYAGEGCTYEDNNKKLLKALEKADNRKAKFRCVIALSDPQGNKVILSKGEINGIISEKISGTKGFGYDPIFFVEEQGCTFAELAECIKNKISHRALALQDLKKNISNLIG